MNISRGKVVDEAALARALAEGRIIGAGLDAFAEEPLPATNPLWDLPNVLMTPHVGGEADRIVAAHERTHPRQHATLSFGRAAQTRRQNTRWEAPGFENRQTGNSQG